MTLRGRSRPRQKASIAFREILLCAHALRIPAKRSMEPSKEGVVLKIRVFLSATPATVFL
jgi:hypothetical protein